MTLRALLFLVRAVAVLAVLAVLGWAPAARAHGAKTAYLEIVETSRGAALATYTIPSAGRETQVAIEGCTATEEHAAESSQRTQRLALACPGGLEGREVRVLGLGRGVTSVVVRVRLAGGEGCSRVLSAKDAAFFVPFGAGEVGDGVFARFVRLGVEHVLGGLDHLLFVLGLVVLARTARRITVAATAFTAAHSLTLAAAALGWLRVPEAAAEACIAASLVLLALDMTSRAGAAVPPVPAGVLAFGFGLVHGLGFAGGLARVGLPPGGVLSALFAFNVGAELGQLAFIGALLAAAAAVRHLGHLAGAQRGGGWLLPHAPVLASYLVGSVGAYLTLARVDLLLRAP